MCGARSVVTSDPANICTTCPFKDDEDKSYAKLLPIGELSQLQAQEFVAPGNWKIYKDPVNCRWQVLIGWLPC